MTRLLIFLYLWLPLGNGWSRIDWEWGNAGPGSPAPDGTAGYVPWAGVSLWWDWLKREVNW